MRTFIPFCVAVLVTLSVMCIVESVADQCCPRGRGKFRNFDFPQNEVLYAKNGIVICDYRYCSEVTYCHLNTSYGGILTTTPPKGLSYVAKECLAPRHDESRQQRSNTCDVPPDDGDVCCATQRYATQYYGYYNNTNWDKVWVLCLPSPYTERCDRYQYVTEGTCVPDSTCGFNNKPCEQEYSVQYLLAYKPGAPYPFLSFEPINIPTYCSCKNIGN